MNELTRIITEFTSNEDLRCIKTTLMAMSMRDCKHYPDLYQNTDIEVELVELHTFLEKLQQESFKIELQKSKADCNCNENATILRTDT